MFLLYSIPQSFLLFHTPIGHTHSFLCVFCFKSPMLEAVVSQEQVATQKVSLPLCKDLLWNRTADNASLCFCMIYAWNAYGFMCTVLQIRRFMEYYGLKEFNRLKIQMHKHSLYRLCPKPKKVNLLRSQWNVIFDHIYHYDKLLANICNCSLKEWNESEMSKMKHVGDEKSENRWDLFSLW